jgi:AraC-like DNA-binding protein
MDDGAGSRHDTLVQLTTFTVDSELGRWTHTAWQPPHLAGIVDDMWHFEGKTTLPRERIFPGGFLEIILHLGPRFQDVDDTGVRRGLFPFTCVTGLQTSAAVIEAPAEPCCVLGIRLRPVGAFALFSHPISELTGLTVDLADLAGRVAVSLAERCYAAPTVEGRFRLVDQWISERLRESPSPDPGIAWAAGRLEASSGQRPIAPLYQHAGLGKTRFVERFREHVGMTPKRYARVLRFRRALGLLQEGRELSEVALAAGYYDQPHMNADFRELAGMTPAAFVSAARYPNSPSLQETP